MLKLLNRILWHRISDYYFYRWVKTKNEKYMWKYIELTS